MTGILIVAGIVLAVVVAGTSIAILAHYWPSRSRTVLVALRTGETLRGELVARHRTYIELARVEVLRGSGGVSSTVDGTVEIDRDNVTWVQVP